MKASLWGYLIMILGIIVTVVILLVSRTTSRAEEDYYLARETLQSALIDSVDYGAYRTTGKVIISKEKFKEVFIRRFAENVTNSQDYIIEFYDIYTEPPKATVRIRTESGTATVNNDSTNFSIDTLLTGILETNFTQTIASSYSVDELISADEIGDSEVKITTTDRFVNKDVTIYESSESYVLSLGTRVTLTIVNDDIDNSACKYNGKCQVIYKKQKNGTDDYELKIIYIDKSLLSEEYPKLKGDTYNKVSNKFCEYSSTGNSNNIVTIYTGKTVKSGGAKTYSNFSLADAQDIAECSIVRVADCDYGPKGNMCKMDDGRYIYESDLTDSCTSSNSSKTDINIEDLKDLEDYDEIVDYINKNNNMLIILDQNGVTDLGTPIAYYYEVSTGKLYSKYDSDSNKLSDEVTKITMPKKNQVTCNGYKTKNGIKVINSSGTLNSSFKETLQSEYGSKEIYYMLYPDC